METKSIHEQYMRLAIVAAEEARQEGGVPIAAVLVDIETGGVMAHGGSLVGVTKDPTSHAETSCIRQACKQRGSDDLYGFALYSTLGPCHMCLSCAAWAKISRVYCGAYRKDVDSSLFDVSGNMNDEIEASLMNLRENEKMKAQGGILENECAQLLKSYHELPKHDVVTGAQS